jgi:hypothetical protein
MKDTRMSSTLRTGSAKMSVAAECFACGPPFLARPSTGDDNRHCRQVDDWRRRQPTRPTRHAAVVELIRQALAKGKPAGEKAVSACASNLESES